MSKVDLYVNGNKNIGEPTYICYNEMATNWQQKISEPK